MWCENFIYQLVVWRWLQINRKRGGWIVTERPVLKWKDLRGLFDVCSAQSEAYLTLLCPHRVRKIGSQLSFIFLRGSLLLHPIGGLHPSWVSMSVFPFLCTFAFWLCSISDQIWQPQSTSLSFSVQKQLFFGELFYDSFAFLTLRHFFPSTFWRKKFFFCFFISL